MIKKSVVLLLLFSVLQGTVSATGDSMKYEPALAMRCGKATQHRDINTGEWISGERDCINGSEELLDYCKKVYKDLTIMNVLLDENTVHIKHWCHVGSSPPCHGHGHSVKPVKCIVGQYIATPLEVEEGCTFHHEIDHLTCFPSAHWKQTASQLCLAKGKTMLKPSMVKACEEHDTYNGVQFLCCQHPPLSTPKPNKGLKSLNLPRLAVDNKHSNVDEICLMKQEVGDCRGAIPRWFYNSISHECEVFIYGGCGGNENNFESQLECSTRCAPPVEEPVVAVIDNSFCGLPYETGECRALFRNYYYDAELEECKQFVYGGCGGNKNNFDMEEDCKSTCAGFKKPPGEPIMVTSYDTTIELEPEVVSSTMTTTTEASTTTELSTTSLASDKPYDVETTLDTEHAVFARFFGKIKKEQQGRRDEALAQFDTDVEGLQGGAKSQKENELQETMANIDAEYGNKINSLHKFHMEKMSGMFEQERTRVLQSFINAVTDNKPRVRYVVASLEAYVNVEMKDKTHVIQHYQLAIDEEFDEGSIAELELRMSEIDMRVDKARTKLSDHPSMLSQIQFEVDEIIARIPKTPNYNTVEKESCLLPMEVGSCKAAFEAYYYDADVRVCKYFTYGGCGGNENRFESMEDCENACSGVSHDIDDLDINDVLSEVVTPGDNEYLNPENEFDVASEDPKYLYPADSDFAKSAAPASYGLNFYLMLGLTGFVILVIIVLAIIVAIRRNRMQPPTKIVVDKPREDHGKELTPEEKQLLALQQNGYENPTYKLLEKQIS